jgi:Kef-type K+ transport system membrane component KefB
MTEIYSLATLWLALALLATLLSIWLRIATAMSEIIVGTLAQLLIGAALGATVLGTDQSWIRFLAGTGAVVLTFLAGAELDPQVMRREWKQATIVGLVAFAAPFLGCAAVARFVVGWDSDASWLAGIALSTTSVAVVYAVMLEFGLNRTECRAARCWSSGDVKRSAGTQIHERLSRTVRRGIEQLLGTPARPAWRA